MTFSVRPERSLPPHRGASSQTQRLGNCAQGERRGFGFTFAVADLHRPGTVERAGVELWEARRKDDTARATDVTPA